MTGAAPDEGADPAPDPDAERLKLLLRRRRSRQSTVHSGPRGVLAANQRQPTRKRLLGE